MTERYEELKKIGHESVGTLIDVILELEKKLEQFENSKTRQPNVEWVICEIEDLHCIDGSDKYTITEILRRGSENA